MKKRKPWRGKAASPTASAGNARMIADGCDVFHDEVDDCAFNKRCANLWHSQPGPDAIVFVLVKKTFS